MILRIYEIYDTYKKKRKIVGHRENLVKCQCGECECPIEGLHDDSFFICAYCKEGKHIQVCDPKKQE